MPIFSRNVQMESELSIFKEISVNIIDHCILFREKVRAGIDYTVAVVYKDGRFLFYFLLNRTP